MTIPDEVIKAAREFADLEDDIEDAVICELLEQRPGTHAVIILRMEWKKLTKLLKNCFTYFKW